MSDTFKSSRTAPSPASSLIESNRVEGTTVFDPTGKRIGTIRRLVIDKESGRVVYVVASFGGFLGLGGTEYTIPWDQLSYDTSLGGFQTDITEAQLRGAPEFSQGDWDYGDRARERTLYDYYGSSYYWRQ